jgi:hypothetical protein
MHTPLSGRQRSTVAVRAIGLPFKHCMVGSRHTNATLVMLHIPVGINVTDFATTSAQSFSRCFAGTRRGVSNARDAKTVYTPGFLPTLRLRCVRFHERYACFFRHDILDCHFHRERFSAREWCPNKPQRGHKAYDAKFVLL